MPPQPAAALLPRLLILAGSILLTLAALFEVRPWLEVHLVEANERQALEDLRELEQASAAFRAATGSYPTLEALVHPDRAGIPWPGPALSPRFLVPVRSGYRFDFVEVEGAGANVMVQRSVRAFRYVAVPLVPERTGHRSFADYVPGPGLRSRVGGVPGPDDEAVKTP